MSEITKTQAELDAFTAKQVMNWVGPICLILFVTDITFFLWGKIDTAKAAIALAGIAAFYFWCARGVKKNQKQAEGIKAGGGSHIPLLIITLLGMTAELTLTYQIANKAAEVFSLNKAPEPVQYAFWVILKLYLVYRMIMWIVYSFDRNLKGDQVGQQEFNGSFTRIGSNLVPSPLYGTPKGWPYDWPKNIIHPIPNPTFQLNHKQVMLTLEQKGEDGLIIDKNGFIRLILKFAFTFTICDTVAWKKTKDAKDQLSQIIFDVLRVVMDKTSVGKNKPTEKVSGVSEETKEEIVRLLNEAAAPIGYLCTSGDASIEKPEKIMKAINEAMAELVEAKNAVNAIKILTNAGFPPEEARLTALAILGEAGMEIDNRRINVGTGGRGGKESSLEQAAALSGIYGNNDLDDDKGHHHEHSHQDSDRS